MRFEIAFKELTYTGFKVLVYCLLNKEEWTAIGYGRWMGLEYKAAIEGWKRGTQDLLMKGWMVGDGKSMKYGEKIREFIGKNEKKE